MRFAGGASWRLSVGDDELLYAALWIRDAVGLAVDADDVPPPLTAPPPRSDVLDGEDLAVIGRDWLGWWRALLAFKVDEHRNPPPEEIGDAWRRWVAELSVRRDAAGSPADDYAALAHAPALQRACTALFRQASRADRRPSHEELVDRPWEDTRRIVDEVAARRGVDPGALEGTIVLVPTTGPWMRVLEPGLVIAAGAVPDVDTVRTALETSLEVS